MSFRRRAQLILGDKEINYSGPNDLRISFDVQRDKSRDPNTATIQVWNLNPSSRAQFENASRIPCQLSVGYADEGVHRVFTGILLDAVTTRENADLVTTFTLGDDGPQKAALARVQRKFPAGTEVGTVLRELIKATGLKLGNATPAARDARLDKSKTLPRAWTASGGALQELQWFSRSLGLRYSIQDGEVRFLGVESELRGRGPMFTSDNIEAPTVDADGTVSFRCRMVPDLIPGVPLRLDTERVKGDYAAIATKHYGDTHGQDWSVDVQADPLSAIISKGLRVNA